LENSSRVTGAGSEEKTRTRTTYGQVLPGGAAIELVASTDRDGVDLFLWNGKEPVIAPQIVHEGVAYQAPALHPSIRQAVWFPSGATEYGTTRALFQGVADLLRRHLGFAEDSAALATIWVFSSWLPEHFSAPPTLCITSQNLDRVMSLFRLLAPLCRLSLVVAELRRQLPIYLRPTLLVSDPGLTIKVQAAWRASNFHGVYVPANGGMLRSLACAKAVFSEMGDAADSWGAAAMYLTLLPTANDFPPLTEQEQAKIAAEFQPQLLMWRLRHLHQEAQSGAASCQPEFASFQLARSLWACISEEPEIAQILGPLLQSHERELLRRRSLDPHIAILEAIWAAAHEKRELNSSEITKRVNAILRSRGEVYEYTSREVGWKLRQLGLYRHRNGNGRALRFSCEIRSRVHQLAREFGVNLPRVEGCRDCSGLQKAEG
jgi:hypothetical protein